MGVLSRLDALAAKHLFHPPVIAICQHTGQTHYAVGHALNFLATVYFTWHMHMSGWFWFTVIGMVFSVFTMLFALRFPEAPLPSSSPAWRFVAWVIISLNLPAIVISHDVSIIRATIFWILTLFYEYTKTIVTIPPKKRKEKKTKMVLKESKA